ncbi:very short patch repair endonuclease [Rhizobium oryziradicis]|uniref:Very short patch repair endonuclease n=1 Tax=Rhizobium oryziradicis TaxID=1867956 RepID=A0A1Q8ZR76_9HYPH|nr:very short patch repair endonuclease [Rhizobium oryziradicis]OLP44556.1 very short patch repair endonuclease [Rhizobium oryziradicis]
MTDIVDPETRSRMMAGIKGKNTKPELVLRRALHALGLRFRLHNRKIKGMPDLAFPKFKAVVFVHGCFWHRHAGCKYATTPSTRPEFWQTKFAANVARDAAVKTALLESGFRMATVWECALRKPWQVQATADLVADWLASASAEIEIGEVQAGRSLFSSIAFP